MKKYVAPMSCVLSMKMDENIAYSDSTTLNGQYALDGGKIQNTPIVYVTNSSHYLNNILYSIGVGLVQGNLDGAMIGQYLTDMSTTCYIGEGDPEQVDWPLG